jgi:hypothetical protein
MMTPPERSPVVLVYSPRAREGSPLVRRIERPGSPSGRRSQNPAPERRSPRASTGRKTDDR